jgi:hypothetical protein
MNRLISILTGHYLQQFALPNVCVCAVVGFRSRHCPRGQTLNEDNTLNLHVTPPLRKHFVGFSVEFNCLLVNHFKNTVVLQGVEEVFI